MPDASRLSPEAVAARVRNRPPMGRRNPITRSPRTVGVPIPPKPEPPPPPRPDTPTQRGILAVILALALALRVREALSSGLLPGSEPFLHVERTWDLMQGNGVHDFPLGFPILLSPLTFLGPGPFYFLARFLPALLGCIGIFGGYLIVRRHVGTDPALVVATLTALMPEHIVRSSLLTPTALDLAALPFLFLLALEGSEGKWKSLVGAGAIAAILMMTHPWIVLLLIPPVVAFGGFAVFAKSRHGTRFLAAGLSLLLFAVIGLKVLPNAWNPLPAFFAHGFPRLGQLLLNPGSLFPLPGRVNFFLMLGPVTVLLWLWGCVLAARHRTRFAVFGLAWTACVVPFTLVDWFGIPSIPARSMIYLGLGAVLLTGLPVRWILERTARVTRHRVAVGTIAAAGLVMLPYAYLAPSWHRPFDDDDLEAWTDLSTIMDAEFVVFSSAESRAGYRALTAREAFFDPEFFNSTDSSLRREQLEVHPDLIVLIDETARESGFSTTWLYDWQRVGRWGDVEAFVGPQAKWPPRRPGVEPEPPA